MTADVKTSTPSGCNILKSVKLHRWVISFFFFGGGSTAGFCVADWPERNAWKNHFTIQLTSAAWVRLGVSGKLKEIFIKK